MDRITINKADLVNYVFGADVVIPRAWKTKPHEGADATTVNGSISFAGCAVSAVLPWATSDRIIARQRVERTMAEVPESCVVPAAEAGRKIRTLEEMEADAIKVTSQMSDEDFEATIRKMEEARGK